MSFIAKSGQTISAVGANLELVGVSANIYSFADNGTVCVAGGQTTSPVAGVIFYSDDRGETWKEAKLYPQTGAVIVDIKYINNQFVASGSVTAGAIFVSSNGKEWFRKLTTTISSVAYSPSLNTYVVVNHSGTNLIGTTSDLVNLTSSFTMPRSGTNAYVIWTGTSFLASFQGYGLTLRSTNGTSWTYTSEEMDKYTFASNPSGIIAYAPFGICRTSTDNINWNTITTHNATQTPTDVIWDSVNSRYVASLGNFTSATTTGYVATSLDGLTWTNRYTETSNGLWSIARNGSTFVACGQTGKLSYSLDSGTTWAATPNINLFLPSSSWNWCTGNSSRFVATSNTAANLVTTSDDGGIWIPRVTSTTFAGYTLTGTGEALWNGSMFVCIVTTSTQSRIIYSSDGLTWTMGDALPQSSGWTGLAWNGSVWTVVKTGSTNAAYSADGITWLSATLPVSASWTRSAGIIGGRTVIIGDSTNITVYSTDGINWTQGSIVAVRSWQGMATDGTKLVVSSNNTSVVSVSTDGINWTDYSLPVSSTWQRMAWNGTAFCVTSNGTAIAAVSSDGQTWYQIATPFTGGWAVGASGNRFCILPQSANRAAVSFDSGSYFTAVDTAFAWNSVIHDGTKFVVVGTAGSEGSSTDGINWTFDIKRQQNGIATTVGTSGAINGTMTIAFVGNGNAGYYLSPNNGRWWVFRSFPTGVQGEDTIAAGNGFFVAGTGGITTSLRRSSDGSNWTTSAAVPSDTYALFFGAGKFFAMASGTTASYQYSSDNGATWTGGTMPSAGRWRSVAWNGTTLCALNMSRYIGSIAPVITNNVAYSSDGVSWTNVTLPVSGYWTQIIWTGSVFMIVGAYESSLSSSVQQQIPNNVYLTSPDGINWTSRTFPVYGAWTRMAVSNTGRVVVIAALAYTSNSYQGSTNTVLYSDDTINWGTAYVRLGASSPSNIMWTGREFFIANNTGTLLGRSTNGIHWNTDTEAGIPSPAPIRDIEFDGSKYIAVGDAGTVFTSSDLVSWSYSEANNVVSNYRKVKSIGTTLTDDVYPDVLVLGAGTSGSTLIPDSSNNNCTYYARGVSISTAVSKWGSSSVYFPNTSVWQELTYVHNDIFDIGTSDFTLEAWINPSNVSSGCIFNLGGAPYGGHGVQLYLASGKFQWVVRANGTIYCNRTNTGVVALSTNTWYHVAVVRNNNKFYLFLNGNIVDVFKNETLVLQIVDYNRRLVLGSDFGTGNKYTGYMEDVRFYNGLALYREPFTPPSSKFTNSTVQRQYKYFAGGSGGVLMASNDAFTWSRPNAKFASTVNDIAFYNNVLAAVGTQFSSSGGPGNPLHTSTGGSRWTPKTSGILIGNGGSNSYGGGLGTDGTKIVKTTGWRTLTSTDDGVSWSQSRVRGANYTFVNHNLAYADSSSAMTMGYAGGAFYATSGSNGLLRSTDGVVWEQTVAGSRGWFDMSYSNDVCWDGTNFITASGGYVMQYSPDGFIWKRSYPTVNMGTSGGSVGCCKVVTVLYNSITGKVSKSLDHGGTWSEEYSLPFALASWTKSNSDMLLATTTSNTSTYYYTTDGVNWTSGTLPASKNWNYVGYAGSKYLAFAADAIAVSSDGVTWSLSSTTPPIQMRSVAATSDGILVAIPTASSGATVSAIRSTNGGSTWTSASFSHAGGGYVGIVCIDDIFTIAPNNMYNYSSGGFYMYSSYDKGLTWAINYHQGGSGSGGAPSASSGSAGVIFTQYVDMPWYNQNGYNWFQQDWAPYVLGTIDGNTLYGGSSSFLGIGG